ncbi:MAG: ferredoxin family protein [Deltaproteobacteria bacterium]|nr:ferredoxin family protein [Deltaproteobacteria bacterium]MBW2138292.1 ferredoxin family protein [Deltaproteobacteria bacterium]
MPIENINSDLCNGCKICVDGCPMDVIRFDEEANKAYVKYAEDCVACYNCELNCPTEAIYVSPQRGRPVTPAWI